MDKISAKTLFVGKKSVFLPQCHSTNDIASAYIKNRTHEDGMLIYTDYQTAGRGQRGNQWESQSGQNLMFSIILKCHFLHTSQQFALHQFVSLAIHAVLKQYLRHVKIKWPNDIMVMDKKICGILIENNIKGTRIEDTILGIGLNVNQESFEVPTATSLKDLTGVQYDRGEVLALLLSYIESYYLKLKNGQYQFLKSEYHQALYGLGQSRLFEDKQGSFVGQIVGTTDSGLLQIEHNGHVNLYDFKEVRFKVD